MEERLEALETKISYMENSIAELNDVLVDQQRSLDAHTKKIDSLIHLFRELKETGGEDSPHDSKPPHY
ncbi:SlyX family protein [Salinispira pacifica]|uniref:SlyX protein n=1 Tax=Salinispira pacifica TaxID=1307761 RepID=V5WG35_9SPIO|nr:SlyX family protein [Salinispira pacifica]AHC14126.1 hypothetical protein L21SP2_0699 [Salinispira pacifica]